MRAKSFWWICLSSCAILTGTAVSIGAQRTAQQPAPQPNYAAALANIQFREIGPAIMGGRIDEFAVVESDPKIIYVGPAVGGVWKTTNEGTTWTPIFDNQPVSSIGAVVIAPSDPSIVWVGTGEANNRQSSSWGNGIYKSTDAGRTWKNMGLSDTHHIGRVAVHPTNPNIVYVAALGHLWGPNKERGVYKTTDGGKTWQNVLYINEDTGIQDIAMDRQSPDTLYAGAYQHRRSPFGYNGGGPDSAIYKTTDGGATWKKLTRGLPYENPKDGDTGRIGLNIYRRNSNIVYAIVEHKNGGVFRSEDAGETWTRMSDVNPRPVYYSQVCIDPNNDLRIWVLGSPLYYSEDGGKTFIRRDTKIHVDFHAIWIDPHDSAHMLVGSDGGITMSWDYGKTWDFMNTFPIGEFYEVSYDFSKPYRVAGGLQDNGSWMGPIMSLFRWGQWSPAGTTNNDWFNVDGSDGYYTVFDPKDPNIIYAETPDGNPLRRDLRSTESRPLRPKEGPGDPRYRFFWDSPLEISSQDNKVIYYGGQFLFRSTDRGDSWTKISSDLTTGVDQNSLMTMGKMPDATQISRQDGVWNYPTITTISESALNPNILWVGTDDGLVQVTRDLGKTWQNVTAKLPGIPKLCAVSRVLASQHAEGTAYVTLDNHRNNDFEAYVYTTTDYGQTWKLITAGLRKDNGAVRAVAEHFRNPNLLFVGTETGVYASLDRGANWIALKGNFPTVPVADIAIHPRENDLILATHGRSFWLIDDITPLEQLSSQVMGTDLHLFDIRAAVEWRIYDNRRDHGGPGHKFYIAENPPYGSLINYYLKAKPADNEKVMISVEDAQGKKIREFEGTKEAGLNRVAWDLRAAAAVQAPEEMGGGFRGAGRGTMVDPGTYTVKVTLGQKQMSKPAVVEQDTRISVSPADLAVRREAINRVSDLTATIARIQPAIQGLNTALTGALEAWKRPNAPKVPDDVSKAAEDLAKRAKDVQDQIYQERPRLWLGSSSPPLGGYPPVTIPQKVQRLGGAFEGYTAAPPKSDLQELDGLAAQVKDLAAASDKIIQQDFVELNKKLTAAGLPALRIRPPQRPAMRRFE